MAGILGMTSHYEQTSPVLRGAWVLDTLLGTPVPPPPPDVPPLDTERRSAAKLSTRERVLQHRADPACSACHKLMDPIGFGLENFDWMGRWRDQERDGKPIDATGELPSGEKFNGVGRAPRRAPSAQGRLRPPGHRQDRSATPWAAASRMAIAAPSSDSSTRSRTTAIRARTLIREIVLSLPFRNTQGGVVKAVPIDAPKLEHLLRHRKNSGRNLAQ